MMDIYPNKRVLVCPLGWGLGHASRVIPIIRRLQEFNYHVIVAGDQLQMDFIADFFPNLEKILFPSLKVRLSKGSNSIFHLLWITVRLPLVIIKEHYKLKQIVKEYKIDIVISDNRYGLWNKGVKSVFITHQLKVFFPKPFNLFEPIGELLIRWMIKKYDYCWIPDLEGPVNLSGELSHRIRVEKNYRYIGPLSRFRVRKSEPLTMKWDLVGVSSGPSPQREIFIGLLFKIAKAHKLKALIIKGNINDGVKIVEQDGVSFAGHLRDTEFADALYSANHIITRSGYSTIMDLTALGISCLIVPTPGQTEQEYLAKYLSTLGLFKACRQGDLEKIDFSISKSNSTTNKDSSELLENAILELISDIS